MCFVSLRELCSRLHSAAVIVIGQEDPATLLNVLSFGANALSSAAVAWLLTKVMSRALHSADITQPTCHYRLPCCDWTASDTRALLHTARSCHVLLVAPLCCPRLTSSGALQRLHLRLQHMFGSLQIGLSLSLQNMLGSALQLMIYIRVSARNQYAGPCDHLTCSFWPAARDAARRSFKAALSRAARFCAKSSSYSNCRTSLSRSNSLPFRHKHADHCSNCSDAVRPLLSGT